jgi:superfamily II DNA or RNA helicase
MTPMLFFFKASSLPPGARWITVRPHGPGTEGQPVLIQPSGEGGSYHVIGGAGGKLNYLKLKGVKSEDDYKAEAKQRSAGSREERKRRQAADKEAGLTASKTKARESLKAQLGDAAAKTVQKVADALGWKPEDMAFDEAKYRNVSEQARKKAAEQHARSLVARAEQAIDFQRRRIVVDAETRHEAGLGEVALTSARPEDLSVQDLNPITPETKGLGFAPEYGKRAAEKGATKEEIAAEAEAAAPPLDEKQKAAKQDRKEVGERIAAELELIREPGPKLDTTVMIPAKKAVELLKIAKEFDAVKKQVREKMKQVDTAKEPVDAKAYIIEEGGPVDAEVVKGLESDLRTLRTRGFLEEVGRTPGGREGLGRHIGVGAFNAVNALALAAGGSSLLDRSVVDVMGVGGAAQILARRLRADLTGEEFQQAADAMQAFHIDRYMTLSDQALREAHEWHEMASEVELGEVKSGQDLTVAQELNAKRRDFIRNAERILGTSLGEMEANAALVVALGQPSKKKIDVSLGKTSLTSAVQQARAIGLEKGDYEVEQAGPNTVLTVHESGLDKLSAPVSRADMRATREALDIIEGRKDEDNWLPEGVADRPDLAMNVQPGVAPRLAKPFTVTPVRSQPRSLDRAALEARSLTGGADGEVDAAGLAGLFHREVSEAVARGDLVMLHHGDGKQQELTAKNGRAVMASDGAGVGVLGALSDKRSRLEITPRGAGTNGDMPRAVADYIGGRTADGDAPAEIIQGLLSEDTQQASGDRNALIAAVNEIAPLYGADGKMVRVETYGDAFNALADKFVEKAYGADRTPFQKQGFPINERSVDALHRALAAHPEGVAAFKAVGDLSPQDQGALRAEFARQYAKSDPKAEPLRQAVEALDKQEPPRETEGLFGVGANPDWTAWKLERDRAAEAANAAILDWPQYVQTMGSPAAAYAAMQDVVRSAVLKDFAEAHNKLNPGAPLKLGRQVIQHDLNHLAAIDPAAREKRQAQTRKLIDSLRNRVAGQYASGSVAEKQEAARAADLAASQAQMGLFGQTEEEEKPERPLEPGERYALGQVAERQIAGMMSVVGENFRPGEPVKMWKPAMSGKYVGRQRAVKLIEHNKRTVLGMGVGSGKTSVMLSAFTDLKSKGNVHRGLFLVPSVVQGQFHGEALTLLKPGTFHWHADPGADRDARVKAYKDKGNDFSVVTHQAFRDDVLHLAGMQEGLPPVAIAEKLDAMEPPARKAYMAEVLRKEGIDFDYLAVDEGHNLLNRSGKNNSNLANVVDAISGNTQYYTSATADPVKNDPSEAFDVLAKMDPDKYNDRNTFMRKYGVDTAASREGLKREMARYFYTASIDPGVAAHKQTVVVPIEPSAGQHDTLGALDAAAAKGRLARMRGEVDIEAMRTLSPNSFKGAGDAEAIARSLQTNLGIIHNTAVQHAINDGAKMEALAKIADERKGKPGVVFIHNLDRVEQAAARLTKAGHRVVTLTGADSSAEKDKKKRDYQAGKYDVMVASDAGAVGANLQYGKWLCQFDTPVTAMLHAQRNGRIHRIGQTEDVELLDLVADHSSERRARARLETKYGLRDIMTSPLDGLDDSGIAGYLNQAKAGKLATETQTFMPAEPGDVPEGLSPPDEQQDLF